MIECYSDSIIVAFQGRAPIAGADNSIILVNFGKSPAAAFSRPTTQNGDELQQANFFIDGARKKPVFANIGNSVIHVFLCKIDQIL